MSDPTARPWKYTLAFENNAPNYYLIHSGPSYGGTPVARTYNEADAAFIVKACNNHEALVKALQNLADFVQLQLHAQYGDTNKFVDAAYAVLAKAK